MKTHLDFYKHFWFKLFHENSSRLLQTLLIQTIFRIFRWIFRSYERPIFHDTSYTVKYFISTFTNTFDSNYFQNFHLNFYKHFWFKLFSEFSDPMRETPIPWSLMHHLNFYKHFWFKLFHENSSQLLWTLLIQTLFRDLMMIFFPDWRRILIFTCPS